VYVARTRLEVDWYDVHNTALETEAMKATRSALKCLPFSLSDSYTLFCARVPWQMKEALTLRDQCRCAAASATEQVIRTTAYGNR
jgi:hypothetical protein